MAKLKTLSVFGTRPEAVKMAPLVRAFQACPEIDSIVCVTAQHRQMLDQVLSVFGIQPDVDLNIMHERQTLVDIATRALQGLHRVMADIRPDVVLVHGDTSTTFAGGLAAFYSKIPVAHVEAGLRSGDIYSPFPEEMNRKLAGCMASLHFAPTASNRMNLLEEGVPGERIFTTGNTVIDALRTTVNPEYVFQHPGLHRVDFSRRVIAVTAHRRENLGQPLSNICRALKAIVERHEDVEIVYPVHLNPAVQGTVRTELGGHPRVHLLDPLDLQDMHNLVARCHFVMTDSGGLQEEAPSLGKPVLVLRAETERPEAVAAGTVRMAGSDFERVFGLADLLLGSPDAYSRMARAVNPYGDGRASDRIVAALLHHFGFNVDRPADFS